MRICVLGSGSSGNSTYLETECTKILIDAGLPYYIIVQRLAEIGVKPEEINAIFITHAHGDHIRSVCTFERLYGTPVFAPKKTQNVLKEKFPAYPWNFFEIEERYRDIEVVHFSVSHGMGEEVGLPVNFLFYVGNATYAHLTDLGKCEEEHIEIVRGANCIHIEANYEENIVRHKLKNPAFANEWDYLRWVASSNGHLSNTQCSNALSSIVSHKTKHVFLAHLSENHPEPRKDNNSYTIAKRKITLTLKVRGILPEIHRTYRRGASEGRKSDIVTI
ncbi:MAG: MBL fold metallo-hydrolase [Thermoplasmata archaeon]